MLMLMCRRQDHVLVDVVVGAERQDSGALPAVANNPEASLAGLTNHILFLVRGVLCGPQQ